jgi:hypothetical protein
MAVTFTWAIEMNLAGTFTPWTVDVSQVASKSLSRGIDGTSPSDRVAKVGTFSFSMENSAANSGAKVGYYSPDNTNARAGFQVGTKTRWSITYGGTTFYKFYGKISDITPAFGLYRERKTAVQCVDFMDELLTHYLDKIAVQTNKRGNELLATIVGNLPTAPLATNYATGPDIFAYSMHDVQDEKTSAMNAIQRVDQSGLSFTFPTGDTSGGETLVWQSRHTRLLSDSIGTISDNMVGLQVGRRTTDIYNTIKATGFPVSAGTSPEVLWTSQREIALQPGGTVTPSVRFTDPLGSGKRIAVVPGSEVTPVADTDYKMSSLPGNGGNDQNANLTIGLTWGGNTASLNLSAPVYGYINLLKLRANIIRLYDPAENIQTDATSKALYGDRTLPFQLPYLDSINTITAFAVEILALKKDQHTVVDSVEFIANDSAQLMALAMALDVGSRFTLYETVTGISSDYYVNTYELTQDGPVLRCRLGNLETAGLVDAGMWGTGAADSGEWGTDPSDSTDWIF